MGIQTSSGGAYNPGAKPVPKPPTSGYTTPATASGGVSLGDTAVGQLAHMSGPSQYMTPQYSPSNAPINQQPAAPAAPAWHGAPPSLAPPMGAPGAPAAGPGEGFGPGFGEQYGRSHVGQYDQQTDLERFAQQQMNGTNPYYQRLQQQGSDAINQQMIARGHGNSGGAFAALGNYRAGLDAAQFNEMGSLLGAAGSQGLQRMGQGQNVANGVQSQQQQRLGQQWGQLSDIAHLGAGTTGGFYGAGGQLSGDAAMSGINAGANASQLQGQGQQAFTNTLGDALKFGAKL